MPTDALNNAITAISNSYAPYSSTPPGGSNLAEEAAQKNIAAAPSMDTLAQLLSSINQKAYLSAPGRQQSLGVIQNQLAGNLDPQTIQDAQLNAAQRYGSSGFGVDSGAWQSSVQRALGIGRQALQAQGEQGLNALYSGMPVTDASQFAVTPGLLETQHQNQAQNALAAQQLAQQASQFNVTTAEGARQFNANLQQRAAEAAQQAAQANNALKEQQREYDLTHSSTVANQIAVLQEQAREANQNAQLEAQKLQMAQTQFGASQAQQQGQFTASQAQQQAQFAAQLAQQQAQQQANQYLDFSKLYSQNYGGLPGYNQQGMYTGQIGGYGGMTQPQQPIAAQPVQQAQPGYVSQPNFNTVYPTFPLYRG